MKLAYFLQAIKGLPLEYDFRLYTYGPFDSDVLNDLGVIESMGAVKSSIVRFSGGYGYEFSPGKKHAAVRKLTGNAAEPYQDAIRWALDHFGQRSAADLELLSTIVFADREAAQERRTLSFKELARTVREIKPRFSEEQVLRNVKELAGERLLVGSKA